MGPSEPGRLHEDSDTPIVPANRTSPVQLILAQNEPRFAVSSWAAATMADSGLPASARAPAAWFQSATCNGMGPRMALERDTLRRRRQPARPRRPAVLSVEVSAQSSPITTTSMGPRPQSNILFPVPEQLSNSKDPDPADELAPRQCRS